MAKPKNIDLTADGVITQEALLAYAEGRLSDAERAEMDTLLANDPFAQEALEGLRQSAAPAEIHTAVTSINSRLREKTGLRERKKKGIEIHWVNYAYAAVVLGVLIGVGFVMIHVLSGEQKQEAMNKDIPKAQESLPVPEEKKKEDTTASTLPLDTTMRAKDTISTKPGSFGFATTTPASGAAPNTPTAADAQAMKKTAAPSQMAYADKSANMAESNEKAKLPMNSETAAQLGLARTYFETGDFVNAEKKYNEVLAVQPDNADALYFGGVSGFLNGSKTMGEPNFDKLLRTSLYPDGTKWYKASILIRKGNKEAAKPLLRDLINSNSTFKDRAVKQYEDLFGK